MTNEIARGGMMIWRRHADCDDDENDGREDDGDDQGEDNDGDDVF